MESVTPNLIRLSKALAFKLRDPVDTGLADGKISAEDRFMYLSRGFGKFIRNIQNLTDELETIFPELYNLYSINHDLTTATGEPGTSSSVIDTIMIPLTKFSTNEKIFSIYKLYIINDTNKKAKGNIAKPSIYADLVNGVSNTSYQTDKDKLYFYYTILNGHIRFFSNALIKAKRITIFAKRPIPNFVPEGAIDLIVPGDFEDILLAAAALEASMDTENLNKVKLYQSEFDNEIVKLSKGRQLKEATKSNDVTEE